MENWKGVDMAGISRRRFIKNALVVGAGFNTFPLIFVRKAQAAWQRGSVVHPNVNNLLVAGVTDSKMTTDYDPVSSWSRQEELVNEKLVSENIDRLACTLADTQNPDDAWRTIFIKPPGKSWSDTVVAIKTNHISRQHTRSAVLAQVCHTLSRRLGVKPHNIHIYDACHGKGMSKDTPFKGLPGGCRIEERWGGSTVLTSVPELWTNRSGKSECLKYLVNGSVDILVNIAMCKGHSKRFGGFTMTMKNHLGTFSPAPAHQPGSLDYLLAIQQTPEILGAMDPKTGKVIYPRQQLCLVDALWASKHGPSGNPSHQPNFLAMGVMAPIVDYQIATKFRGDKMGWRPNMEAARRMLTDFGYKESDLPYSGRLVEV
jgi:hypothetical protein